MPTLLDLGLSNAVLATGLAVIAAILGRLCRRPALVHSLWLLVLLKLLTPAFVPVPLPWSLTGRSVAKEGEKESVASPTTAPADLSASLDRLEADLQALRPSASPASPATREEAD